MPSSLALLMTGTRADWSKMQPIARGIVKSGAFACLDILSTGMHEDGQHGNTGNDIEGSVQGVRQYHRRPNHLQGSDPVNAGIETMKIIADLTREHGYTDIFIHGDRIEANYSSLVALSLNMRIHHIEGGEITGSVDNALRYSVSAHAHFHYVCNEEAKNRLIRCGNNPATIFVIGSPEMDRHAQTGERSLEEIKRHHKISYDKYGIASLHPVTTVDPTVTLEEALYFFFALRASGKSWIVIKPNNDPNSEQILLALEKVLEEDQKSAQPQFFVTDNIPFDDFSTLQANAAFAAGNSSAMGRAQNMDAVINIKAFIPDLIVHTIKVKWDKKFERDTTFGTGKAEETFTQILAAPGYLDRDVQKRFFFSI
ncbi:hypothetical protein H2248_006863 [Termitomyces sp. 'cryptogamus']|nr:hypothetical protein H2248_006863 [Termitomyces sp. 'cryptogamus']